MGEAKHSVEATDDQEDVARLFERYNLLSVGVVDESGRLVGVITIDDIVDIIEEEADEDIKRLAGVGDEEISDRRLLIRCGSRSSGCWSISAPPFSSASVIGLFEGTIERIWWRSPCSCRSSPAMGGNAGTQTMTVAVRALATREIETINSGPLHRPRRRWSGFTNGVLFGCVTGTLVALLVRQTGARRRHRGWRWW